MNVTVLIKVNTKAPDLYRNSDINKIRKGSHILNKGMQQTEWRYHKQIRPRIQILG